MSADFLPQPDKTTNTAKRGTRKYFISVSLNLRPARRISVQRPKVQYLNSLASRADFCQVTAALHVEIYPQAPVAYDSDPVGSFAPDSSAHVTDARRLFRKSAAESPNFT